MNKIVKYKIPVKKEVTVTLPAKSKLLTILGGVPYNYDSENNLLVDLYVEIDTSMIDKRIQQNYYLKFVGTNHVDTLMHYRYWLTVTQELPDKIGNPLVWQVYTLE